MATALPMSEFTTIPLPLARPRRSAHAPMLSVGTSFLAQRNTSRAASAAIACLLTNSPMWFSNPMERMALSCSGLKWEIKVRRLQ